MPLAPPLTVCTSIPKPTVNSSTWIAFAPIPKSKLYLCVTCSSLTMLPSLLPHSEAALPLRRLINKFASEFGLTLSLKKTNVSAKDLSHVFEIKISDHTLEVVDEFTYLRSTNSTILSPKNRQIQRHHLQIDQESLGKQIPDWLKNQNAHLPGMRSQHVALRPWNLVHLLETQGRRLNSFHLQCLKRILGVKWQDHVLNSEILSRAEPPACTPYLVIAAWDGLDMFITWMMDSSPKKFYKVNWREEPGNSGAPLCDSKTHANMTLVICDVIAGAWG